MVELTSQDEGAVMSWPADDTSDATPPAGETERSRRWTGLLEGHERAVRLTVDGLVVAACTIFVLLQLGPTNLLSNSTPAGGDMGAHVWGPAFLRDELLPDFQLAGWAPDWYAGFAAYQFYFVVPMLAIVALDVGVVGLTSLPGMVLAIVAAAWFGIAVGMWPDRRWRIVAAGVPFAAVLLLDLPYGVAFKLVAVSGALTLPLAAYAFGRLAAVRFPGPALLAVATLPYLFYQGYNIYGGNLASLLAGEFAFSISLSFGLVYLGLVLRGLETGRHRALAAVLLALTGLCHIIPAFWVLGSTVVIVLLRLRPSRGTFRPGALRMCAGMAVMLVGLADWLLLGWPLSAFPGPVSGGKLVAVAGAALFVSGAWLCSQSVRWLLPVLSVGGLLSAFWVVPFVGRADFVNHMGWEKEPTASQGSVLDRWGEFLLPGIETEAVPAHNLVWVFGLALVGAALSIALRLRVGIFLTAITVLVGVAFVLMPETRLWNARILPFYYLTAMLLAFLAVALVLQLLVLQLLVRLVTRRREADVFLAALAVLTGLGYWFVLRIPGWEGDAGRILLDLAVLLVVAGPGVAAIYLARRSDRPPLPAEPSSDGSEGRGFPAPQATALSPSGSPPVVRLLVGTFGALGALLAVLVVVGLPLDVLPLSEAVRGDDENPGVVTSYRWPSVGPVRVTADVPETVNVPVWADWNFSGYENKDRASEFHEDKAAEYFAMIAIMDRVGEERGCGRAFWEYDGDTLEGYGTPMAPMLLPYWTDGCIASMEGLYFEASMTVPYHFLMQDELSEGPSRAQRNMPYGGFNLDLGVQHLQLMGVRYYMATTETAIESARRHPALTEIATSEPWEVFEVADSELVTPLAYEPAVLSGVGHAASDWLEEPGAYLVPGASRGEPPPPDGTAAETGRRDRGTADAEPGPWPLAPDGWAEDSLPPPPGAEDDETYVEPAEHFFGPSVQWFLNPPEWDVPLAVSGPSEWQRIEQDEAPALRPVSPAEVSDIEVTRERISFEVDEPGSPVLVKMSYFPNWQADGAEGPWRVAPNLMVVVPTENEVTLSYRASPLEWLGYLLTVAGLVALVVLAGSGRFRFERASAKGLPGRADVVGPEAG